MKKLFTKAIEWLRRRVTALRSKKGRGKSEEVGSRGLNENDNVNDDDNRSKVEGESVSSYPLLRTSLGNEVRWPKGKATPPPCGHPRLRRAEHCTPLTRHGLALSQPSKDLVRYKQRGSWENGGSASSEEPLLIRIEEFIGKHYRVRLNALSQQYEVTARGAEQWMAVNGTLCNRILMELNRAGIILAKPYLVRTVIEGSALAEGYHPVRSYLESLPQWDGTERIEALFRRVTNDEQLLGWLRKWFIAMVAQALDRMGKYGNSVCPILISARQGWGKSQFAKLLVPPELGGFFTDTFNLQQEDGCLRRMTAYMLINVDEIDRFGERRMATFKNMVQLAVVSMKRAYHTQMEEKERMASFIATSNRRHLLSDESGSRRFICVELTHAIDVTTPVDHAQLYAEAMAAIEAGERCWFTEEETRELEAHNAGFAVGQGVWALMKRCLTLRDIPEGNEKRLAQLHSANEVYDYLCHQSPSAMSGIERSTFGYLLTEFGARQVRVRNKRVYGVCLANANADDNVDDN